MIWNTHIRETQAMSSTPSAPNALQRYTWLPIHLPQLPFVTVAITGHCSCTQKEKNMNELLELLAELGAVEVLDYYQPDAFPDRMKLKKWRQSQIRKCIRRAKHVAK